MHERRPLHADNAWSGHFVSRCQDIAKRTDDVKKFGLFVFKRSFEEYITVDGVKSPGKFITAVEKAKNDTIEQETKQKTQEAVATAKAAMASREAVPKSGGVLSSLFGV
eukprot:15291874-Alexandrium_andersonii.AAC.1